MNKIDLNGRSAVVTGGAQGFGRAITERFVASGAKVAIWDHDLPFAEKTAKEIGAGVTAFKVDVSDLAAVEKTPDATLKSHSARSTFSSTMPASPASTRRYGKPTSTNGARCCASISTGPSSAARRSCRRWSSQKYGRIVNIASIAGKEGNPNAAHYSASKAGLIALTKSLGKELAAHDIAVNAVTPAAAKTAIFDQMTQAAHRLHAVEDSEGPFRAGGRTRGDGGVAGLGGLRVLHRRGVRHFRRARDVLGRWAQRRHHDPGRRMPVRRGPVQGRGRADQCPHLPLPQLARRRWDRRSLPARCSLSDALTIEGDTGRYASSEAIESGFLQNLRHAAVFLAHQRHGGRRRPRRLRRSPRVRADRTHLGQGKDELGEA